MHTLLYIHSIYICNLFSIYIINIFYHKQIHHWTIDWEDIIFEPLAEFSI